MGLWANYPIAVAPAMGHNFYVALVVAAPAAAGGMGHSWQVALGANCLAGLGFLALSLGGFREKVIDAIPPSLQHAIAGGIGLLIAFLGLQWGGLVRRAPGTLVGLGDLHEPVVLAAAGGMLVAATLHARGVRGAILCGMAVTAAALAALGRLRFHGVVALPPSLAPTFGRLDVAGALRPGLAAVVFTLLFLGLFDTVGTLVGIATQAGLMRAGRLPRAREAMATDALGTVVGTVLGTSTVTAYVESAAGVAEGARTGLASVVTAACLLAALFLAPLAAAAGAPVTVGDARLYPVVAPALVLVGSFMARSVARIDFADPPVAFASFVTLITMPLAFSITEGIALGAIVYAVLMPAVGRGREVHPLLYFFAAAFVLRYAALQ
jgi:AGZA family xanthine/uracil permease-like MFS transporter